MICWILDEFNIRGDSVFRTEVEHLLSFSDTADDGPGKPAAFYKQRKTGDWQRMFGCADQRQGSVNFEQFQIGIHIVLRGDGVQNEVEAVEMVFHLGFVL